MFAADDLAGPHLSVVADAAKEIAELKAKIAKLEKLIDGVMAHHLSSAEPMPVAVDGTDGFDVSCDDLPPTVAAITSSSFAPTLADDISPIAEPASATSNASDDTSEIGDTEDDLIVSSAAAPNYDALPSSVLSLICRPTKTALASTDDLTLIATVDAFTALELAAHGANRFEDIANLDAQSVAEIMQKIPGTERLLEDNWIEQAAVLASGELTAYACDTLEQRAEKDGPPEVREEQPTYFPKAGGRSPLTLLDRKPTLAKALTSDIPFEIAAETALKNLTERDLPRTMAIARPMTDALLTPENEASFLPMAASDAGFAVKKIQHRVAPAPKDHGNVRALAASLTAAAAIVVGSFLADGAGFGLDPSQIMRADVCQMVSQAALSETCKQILATVL